MSCLLKLYSQRTHCDDALPENRVSILEVLGSIGGYFDGSDMMVGMSYEVKLCGILVIEPQKEIREKKGPLEEVREVYWVIYLI